MDENKSYSKKELKELRKLAELEKTIQEKKQNTVKWIAITLSSVLFLFFFAWIVVSSKQSATQTVSDVTHGGHVRGNVDAKVALVEFSDLQCPACRAAKPNVDKILNDYKDKVKLVYKHFPLKTVHKNALAAAYASEAAAKQDKFFEFHDLLFEKQDDWANEANPEEKFLSYVKELKLKEDQFKKDVSSEDVIKKVQDEEQEAIENGVNSTPTFFVNNKKVDYNGNYDDLKKAVDDELKNG